jgi:hypothetical protein
MTNEFSGKLAERRFREADAWWLCFDMAVHRYRCWAMLYRARKGCRRRLPRRLEATYLIRIADQINEAHDHLVLEVENIWTAARCAVAAEMAGKIYDEECDDRPARVG